MTATSFSHPRHQKQMELLNQKETFLTQRKLDIKNMEEGFSTLRDLNVYVLGLCHFKIFFVYASLNWNNMLAHVIHVEYYREVRLWIGLSDSQFRKVTICAWCWPSSPSVKELTGVTEAGWCEREQIQGQEPAWIWPLSQGSSPIYFILAILSHLRSLPNKVVPIPKFNF